jgi:hypothetical protein
MSPASTSTSAPGGWLGHELGVDFEVQVGQQLDLHVASLVNHGE